MKNPGTLMEKLRQGEHVPLRFENPYVLRSLDYRGILSGPEEIKLQPLELFPDTTRPFFVEVGCYLGKTLGELAATNPNFNFLGLEITYKRAVKTARSIQKNQLKNAHVGLCEAADFFKQVPDASVDGIVLFFPDPWPKKKQGKHRLIRTDTLALLQAKLKPHGFVWFKTDSEAYLNILEGEAAQGQWEIRGNEQPKILSGGPYQSVFESVFRSQGLPIFERLLTRESAHGS